MKQTALVKIIKASAGTGKTFNLVKNYLSYLLQNPANYRRVLGLTFTQKAAKEMKKRIIEETLLIAESQLESNILQQIRSNTAVNPYNAQSILEYILFDYSRFDFQTIDSFFYKIVKIFGKELDIHPNFQIEEDTDLFIQLCIEQLYKESNQNDEIRDYLYNFILYRLEEQETWNIDYPIQQLTSEIIKTSSYDYLQLFKNKHFNDFEALKKKHGDFIQKYETEIQNLIQNIQKLIQPYENQKDIWKEKSRGLPSKLKKFKNLRYLQFQDIRKLLIFLSNKEYFNQKKIEFENITEKIYPIYLELNQKLDISKWKLYKTNLFAYQSLQTSALLSKLWEIGEKIKQENFFILMSDINTKIKDFLEKEPSEYLYWRLGNRYEYFLLDEFQDTSETQYNNLKPLVESVIQTKMGYALFVGDIKQSIYRWRGSKPSLLQNLSNEHAFHDFVTEEVLDTNFRSAPEIIQFVKNFFDVITKNFNNYKELFSIYENLSDKAHKISEKGYVKIKKINKENSTTKSIAKSELKEQILMELYQELQNLKNCQDIAILVRTNAESRLVAHFLAQHQIPFTASDSLLMSNSLLIQFLFETLKFLHFPQQPINALTVRNLAYNLNIRFIQEEFLNFAKSIRGYNLYEQTENIIDYFGLYTHLNDDIVQFLEFVHHYENIEYNKNLSFWEWFERYSHEESIVLESKEPIKIMTIHQSKGLEFDVVFCPFLDWSLKPKAGTKYWGIYDGNPYLLSYKQEHECTLFYTLNKQNAFQTETQETILENTNILYVALTRAKKQLYGWFIGKKDSSNHEILNDFTNVADFFELFFKFIAKNEHEYVAGSFEDIWNNPNEIRREVIQNLDYHPWRNHIFLKPATKKDWNFLIQNNDKATQRGIIIHKLLEQLKHINNLKSLVQDFVNQGKITLEDQTTIIEKIETLFQNPLVKLWFSENAFILKEQKIIQKNQESKIPDRLVIHDGVLYIIEYKTGQKYSEHTQQLQEYAHIIQQSNLKYIKPFHTIKQYLLYIDENEIVEVKN